MLSKIYDPITNTYGHLFMLEEEKDDIKDMKEIFRLTSNYDEQNKNITIHVDDNDYGKHTFKLNEGDHLFVNNKKREIKVISVSEVKSLMEEFITIY